MSLKVHYGFELEGRNPRLSDLTLFAERARDVLRPVARRLFANSVAAEIVRSVDLAAFGIQLADRDYNPDYGIWEQAVDYVCRRCRDSRKTWDDMRFDYSCELSLLAGPRGRTLGVVRALSPRPFHEAIVQAEGVRDFRYWDNVEPDETVPARTWAARGRVWDAALADGIPDAQLGLNVDIVGPDTLQFLHLHEVLAAEWPDAGSRVADMTMRVLMSMTVDERRSYRESSAIRSRVATHARTVADHPWTAGRLSLPVRELLEPFVMDLA